MHIVVAVYQLHLHTAEMNTTKYNVDLLCRDGALSFTVQNIGVTHITQPSVLTLQVVMLMQ